jgi:phosphoglycolate phosphatase/pyrophosphatase PpaX
MQMITHLIFDLDGTLGDTLPLCIEAFRKAIEPRVGRRLSDADIIETFGPSEEGTIRQLVPEEYDPALADYLIWYERLHSAYPRPFEGIADILRNIKASGVSVDMVTGKGPRSTEITLKVYGLEKVFELVKTGSPEGPVKPQRLREVIAERGLSAETFLYVGDAPSDIEACREVGMPMVAAAWAETAEVERLEALDPDYLCHTITEFRELLGRLTGIL